MGFTDILKGVIIGGAGLVLVFYAIFSGNLVIGIIGLVLGFALYYYGRNKTRGI